MKNAIVVGGGIIGLSSAYYLKKSGWNVAVIDQGDFSNNCSYGNAGYVCPSHFIPLASPGIISQGLRWMLNPKSPFYIQPRLSWPLIDWGIKFAKSATARHLEESAVPLRDAAIISQRCYEEWNSSPDFDFAYEKKGLFEYFLTKEKAAHGHELVEKAVSLGLDTVFMHADDVRALEPQTRINLEGAVLFRGDAHLYPNKLMKSLLDHLKQQDFKSLHKRVTWTQMNTFNGSAYSYPQRDDTKNPYRKHVYDGKIEPLDCESLVKSAPSSQE
ncbi:MAG: FAD-dependent oxidoreductase [Gemmatimonadaceae bacterium]|nr:FAD-dependent oxidoreductase [Chitinophagaceae bacterium]